jgi:hypothetical protein
MDTERLERKKKNISEHCILANRRFSFETPNDRRLEDGGPRTLTNDNVIYFPIHYCRLFMKASKLKTGNIGYTRRRKAKNTTQYICR